MTTLYFVSPSDTAKISGPELRSLGTCLTPIFARAVNKTEQRKQFVQLLPKTITSSMSICDFSPQCLTDDSKFSEFMEKVINEKFGFEHQGKVLDAHNVVLNTALNHASDSEYLALMTYILCGRHAWIEGPNRTWFADLIGKAMRDGILSPDHEPIPMPPKGQKVSIHDMVPEWVNYMWGDVIKLLCSADDEPVVLSSSMADYGFPNPVLAGLSCSIEEHEQEIYCECWDALTSSQQWEMSMTGLRQKYSMLEFKPDNWGEARFSPGVDAFQLLESK